MTTWDYNIRIAEHRFPGYAWICTVTRDGMVPELTAWRTPKDAARYIRARTGVQRVTWNVSDGQTMKSGRREVE